MILVTGASGHFGSAAIQALLNKGVNGNHIKALVRSAEKGEALHAKGVQLAIGDYNDYNSLLAAMQGVDKVLFVSSSDLAKRTEQQLAVVQAAKEAGVKHIVYTGFERKNETETSPMAFVAKSHIDTESAIKASGLNFTILRNALYADTIPMFLGEKVLEQGVFFPTGNGKAAFATREDMAEGAAVVLTTEGHENKEYKFSNSENYTFDEVAGYLSEIAGKTIPNVNPTAEVYHSALKGAGVPDLYIGMFAGFAEAIKQNEFYAEQTDLEKLLGRKPVSLKKYLTSVYGK
jgi:NAD(P)H dehydrogenase (quinone)